MPPNPPRNAQRLRRAQDMSSTCAGRPLLVLHNFPVFSLLLSIMPGLSYVLGIFVEHVRCVLCLFGECSSNWEHSEELLNFLLTMLFNIGGTLIELSFRTQI